jgi:hypothetical protein
MQNCFDATIGMRIASGEAYKQIIAIKVKYKKYFHWLAQRTTQTI